MKVFELKHSVSVFTDAGCLHLFVFLLHVDHLLFYLTFVLCLLFVTMYTWSLQGIGLIISKTAFVIFANSIMGAITEMSVFCLVLKQTNIIIYPYQAKAVLKFIEAISEKTLRSTVALTAARGRGKSAALGLSVAGAVAFG